jgi:ligand-binding sensor domain-containing protein/signal transduction histidine kinase/DNA-binding response OmpR family regulator
MAAVMTLNWRIPFPFLYFWRFPAKGLMLRTSFSILLCVLLLSIASAQSQSYYFKSYGVSHGLSSNTITSIIQDRKGFIWLGSRNGLNRFDGTAFKIFRNSPTDPTTLGSNSILSLFEDKKEHLWVGTTKGVYIYDPLKERFAPFTKIPSGEIRYIKGDKEHNLWIISSFVLYKYHLPSGTLSSYSVPADETVALNISSSGAVWAATGTGLVRRYNRAKDRFEDYNLARLTREKRVSRVQEIFPIDDKQVMVGTFNHVYQFNTATGALKDVFESHPVTREVQLHTIIQQSSSEFWLGTETGLYVYDIRTGRTAQVGKQQSNPYSITDNVVTSFCRDKEGGTWIGTFFGGVNYYSKEFNKFHKYFPQPADNSLSGNLVHEICSDQWGNLWVGTEDAGLNKINLPTGHIEHFKPGGGKGRISYANLHGLVAVGNELWIGTYEHGLDVLDIPSGKVIRHYNAGSDTGSLKSDFIVTLYKTRQGDILVGTWLGLFRYNRAQDNFSALKFFNTQVQGIHEAPNGVIWVNTYGNGVYYYNPATGKGGNLRHNPKDRNSLVNNYVNGLFQDHRQNFWFSTEGGLTRYDNYGQFTNYTMESGLPDNQVFKVLEDEEHVLWISTSKGLVRMNPSDGTMKIYRSSHGLLTEQFNYNSGYRHTDGTLFFGTMKGLIGFNPKELHQTGYIPPVYITGIQVNNSELPINNTSLKTSVTYNPHITLPYDSSNISLNVAALSYNTPEMNEYLYKMEGLDKEWTAIKSNRKIYYTKLPPGDYTFKVKGSAGNGTWNEKETTLRISILPPWWATTFAYIVYVLIGLSIIFTILRYYYIALNARNKRRIDLFEREKEREIYNAKIDFFTNIAHEIRTPLTLIKMPLDKLINQQAQDPETKESLNIMKKNTNRLIDLTNQLLDFRKAEANKFSLTFTKTDINELLTEMHSIFKAAADQKALSFRLELPRITLNAFVDEEAVKKIIANLVNNAIKYAHKTVSIRLLPFSSEDTSFHIEFKNDGYRIPLELKEKIFEPFYRIKETEKEAGTGIGLPLAKALAELHNGKLELKSIAEGTNLFLLSLPIHQEQEIDLHYGKEEAGENEERREEALASTDPSKPVILLVEDNREILGFIQRELSGTYNILIALNGQEALEVLQKENVHLVISDIMMPVMDGIELCKKIKTDLQYSHVPIILLTAKNSLQSKIEGLEVGADAYIEKPFSFDHLQAQITNLIANRNNLKEYFARSPLTHLKGIAHSNADKSFIEELNAVISDNITDIDLDVDQLSRLMNMSRPTLYRKIKALSNLTPNELINLSRLKKAAELLAEGTYRINEVAHMVGYSVHANFSRDFSKQFGMTPSHYINSLQEDKPQKFA